MRKNRIALSRADLRVIVASAVTGLATSALAHTTLEYPVASAGQGYKATFRIGHGCGASPTRQIVVDIPPGVQGAQPMPKPGWQLEVTRAKLATPYTRHGRVVSEDVVRIAWTAKTAEDMLPNAHYDEFLLVATLPARPGTVYWPVQQVCEQGRHDWTDIPKPGQKPKDLKSPAPALEIMPAAGGAGHAH